MKLSLRVVKIGGSLLEWPELARRFKAWHGRQPPGLTFLVVGGGNSVNQLRRQQPAWGIDDDQAHWLALRLMQYHAVMLGVVLGLRPPITSWAQIAERLDDGVSHETTTDQGLALVDMYSLLQSCPDGVPATWGITSDSLAAWFAMKISCDSLFLLKSALPKTEFLQDLGCGGLWWRSSRSSRVIHCEANQVTSSELEKLSETFETSMKPYVDQEFWNYADKIPRLQFVDLRDASFPTFSILQDVAMPR